MSINKNRKILMPKKIIGTLTSDEEEEQKK